MALETSEVTLIPYVRQSAQRPGETRNTSLSLEAQVRFVREWGERTGYGKIDTPVLDHDLSGESLDRPGIHQLLSRVRPGVHVAVHKWDRFARAEHKQETVVQQIIALGGAIFSCTEPSDRFGRGIYGLMAEEYRRQHGERVQSVLQTKLHRGRMLGDLPWGYRRPHTTDGERSDGTLYTFQSGDPIPDGQLVPHIVEMFERIAAGETAFSVARSLFARGILSEKGRMDPSFVTRIIRKPIYAGWLTWHGDVARDSKGERLHNPAYQIVTQDLWERAQIELGKRSYIRSTKAVSSWLEGSIVHICGKRMYLKERREADRAGQGTFTCRGRSSVPKCNQTPTTIGQLRAEALAITLLTADLTSANIRSIDAAIETAVDRATSNVIAKKRAALDKQRTEAVRIFDRAVQAWMADVLPIDHLERVRIQHDARLAQIDGELIALPFLPDRAAYEAARGDIESVMTLFPYASQDARQQVFSRIGTLVVDGESQWIDYRPEVACFIATRHKASGRQNKFFNLAAI